MTEEDESDKRISGWAGIMHDEFDFVKIMIHSFAIMDFEVIEFGKHPFPRRHI